jgi:hypothetical protein
MPNCAIRGESTVRLVVLALCLLGVVACSAASTSKGSPTVDGDAGGQPIVAEAGFFEVPGQPTSATYTARLFYVFQPADVDAAHKPVVVLSNGGPGTATSAGLLAYGTGRYSLDASADAGVAPMLNASSWTSFANLLYIDARQAGFSYGLGAAVTPACTFSEVEDASDFVRALLEFFDAHPGLRANPVVLAGESYAGTRVDWMLDLLLRYSTEASRGGADLKAKIQAHFDAVFPALAGTVVDQKTASQQFGAQVLIEPVVLGLAQIAEQGKLTASAPAVPDGNDDYKTDEPEGWYQGTLDRAVGALASPASTQLLGTDLRSIPLLQPVARMGTFHQSLSAVIAPFEVPASETAANQALTVLLGALAPGDEYFASEGASCLAPGPSEGWQPTTASAQAFVDNVRTVKTFITNALLDDVIIAAAIPATLAQQSFGGVIDSSPRPGVARPGWFSVDLPAQPDTGAPAQTVEVRFPTYAQSGHPVATSQPADLAADVEAWLTSP